MPQIITPPQAGIQEDASKNWYRAEALRKIALDLDNVYIEISEATGAAYELRKALSAVELRKALSAILEARYLLNPDLRPKPKKRERIR